MPLVVADPADAEVAVGEARLLQHFDPAFLQLRRDGIHILHDEFGHPTCRLRIRVEARVIRELEEVLAVEQPDRGALIF
jgi:hypothetical protein